MSKTKKQPAELAKVDAAQTELLPVDYRIAANNITDLDALLQVTAYIFGEHTQNYMQKWIAETMGTDLYPDVVRAGATLLCMLDYILHNDTPASACVSMIEYLPQMGYTKRQIIGLAETLADYINPNATEYKNWEQQEYCYKLLLNYYIHQKEQNHRRLRDKLVDYMADEIEHLPETLAKMEPADRVKAETKLLPLLMEKEQQASPLWL